MKIRIGLACLVLGASASALAETPPAYLFVNQSPTTLVDDATAKTLFDEIVSQRLAKLYPTRNWGFATVIQGGFTPDKACVVAASIIMLPRNRPNSTQLMLFKPKRMATTFGVLPSATAVQCADLAKSKLREADQAMLSALIPS